MTLKEKIMKLQTYKMFTGEDTVYVERDNVLKLLEQSSCEDCVDRAEVLKIYDEWFATCNIADKKESPKARINGLPSVTPIRPKGHWIDHSNEGYVECPKCGSATNCDDNISDLHFCFACGAEMEGVAEE